MPATPPPPPAAPRPPVPGLPLALFLILLVSVDISGLLHVYSLSSLYSEDLFLGLGALVTLVALGLLAGVSRINSNPQSAIRRARSAPPSAILVLGGGGLALGLAGVAVQHLFAALPAARVKPGDPPLVLPEDVQQATLVFVLGAMSLLAVGIAYTHSETTRRRWLTLLAAGWGAYAVGNLLFHLTGGPAGPDWFARLDGRWAWVPAGLGLLAVGCSLRPLPPPVFLGLALAVGGGLRLLAISQIPVSMNLGDMLPLIDLSTQRLLGGDSPYHLYQVPYDLALTYWPLNVLLFVPFQALGLDLRGANLLLGLTVAGLLLLLRRRGRPLDPGQAPDPGWACYAFGVLYLTPTMMQWDLVTAAPPFWLWLSLLLAVVAWEGGRELGIGGWGLRSRDQGSEIRDQGSGDPVSRFTFHVSRFTPSSFRTVLPGAALGAALAAGPLALPFAPIIGVWWLRRGGRYAAMQVVAAAGVGAVAVLPFVLWDWSAFRLGALDWFNNLDLLPRAKWDTDKSWLYAIGWASQFWKAGQEEWLKVVQFGALGALAVASWWGARTPAAVLRWGSAAYLLFMVFNPVIWPYLFTPALLGLVFSLAARGREE